MPIAVFLDAAPLGLVTMRNMGVATADTRSLDGDVVMAAQVVTCGLSVEEVIVATTNVRHIANYVAADLWRNIVVAS